MTEILARKFVATMLSPKTNLNPLWCNGKKTVSLWGSYAFSSLSYAILGLGFGVPFWNRPLFPYMRYEVVLCISQTVTSYGCDVYSFGINSWWKVADRLHACLFTVWTVAKLLWLRMPPVEWVIWVATLAFSYSVFINAQYAMKTDFYGISSFRVFIFWHTIWHYALPGGVGLWMTARALRLQAEDYAGYDDTNF